MLLRLITYPNPSQTTPTILFTLPMPTHPYTSKSLPLPSNLLAHHSLCLHEDIDCPNVLLGEKSSWISGVIDEITFALHAHTISINFIDGTVLSFPLTAECIKPLHRVIREVQLSFAIPEPTPGTSKSSGASFSSTSSHSTPFLSLLSLSGSQQCVSEPGPTTQAQHPARIHRRVARSLLVDTYRRHVLPALRGNLPLAYLPWVINSETTKSTLIYESLCDNIRQILTAAGVKETLLPRRRSSSSSSCDSEYDSDATPSPITPATSIYSRSQHSSPLHHSSPHTFLLCLPPPHAIPYVHRSAYSARLTETERVAARLHSLKELNRRYEREEGKRRWLEGLERGQVCDRILRRAYVNGEMRKGSSTPVRRSRLWESTTPETWVYIRPAMRLETATEASCESRAIESESESELESMIPPRVPISARHTRMAFSALHSDKPHTTAILVRPPMKHQNERIESSHYDGSPCPLPLMSRDSLLSNGDWDIKGRNKPIIPLWNDAPLGTKFVPPLSPRPRTKKMVELADKVDVLIVGDDVFCQGHHEEYG